MQVIFRTYLLEDQTGVERQATDTERVSYDFELFFG